MNSAPSESLLAVAARRAIAVLGLLAALYGMANVMPAIGDFRLGPFPMEMFRASFFALCTVLVGCALLADATGRNKPWVKLVAVVGVATILYGCWSFYQVSICLLYTSDAADECSV